MRNRLTLTLLAVTTVGVLAATGVAVAAVAPTSAEPEPTVTATLDPDPTATVDPTPTTTEPPEECVVDPSPDTAAAIVPAAFAPAGDFEIDTAVVCKEGKLIRGTAKAAEKIGNTSVYKVEFKRNVDQCTWLATIAGHKPDVIPAGAEIRVYQNSNDPKATVRVNTRDSAGRALDSDFHLAVICPKA